MSEKPAAGAATGSGASGNKSPNQPLADRMRPQTLEEFFGQGHLVGADRILRRVIEGDAPTSMILWGPPGVGKTTLARIIARRTQATFHPLSAVTSGLADVRKVLAQARKEGRLGRRSILFIDEIHRFNKAQQDALLHSVEDGTVTLIGATTENPSFEVIAPLLSRCRVYKLKPLEDEEIQGLITRALEQDEQLKNMKLVIEEDAFQALVGFAGGDARQALSSLELCSRMTRLVDGKRTLTVAIVKEAFQRRTLGYDKTGDQHYDTISAFIKSVRGSDPDAAVYWMARMIESGEDPLFIARRLIILASEDIGNADPQGLVVATAAFQAVHAIGMPEGRIVLAQAATYLASAPKSNAAYQAIGAAQADIRQNGPEPVPMPIRNAPTGLMKEMGYGDGYQYPHDFPGGFTEQEYLPQRLKSSIFYAPKSIGEEKEIKSRLDGWWAKRRPEKNSK